MHPLLRTGDRVELDRVERREVRPGDILVFTAADGREIIHRVVRISPLQTRGDNCGKDDLPVPDASPLYRAVSFRRNGRMRRLSAGSPGVREFRRNQLRRKLLSGVKKILSPFAAGNPCRIPFRKLKQVAFPGKTVCYAWKYPVGWFDQDGWHWMRYARYFVEAPPEEHRE